MKKEHLKQVAGIDVAKDELVVTLGHLDQDLNVKKGGTKSFKNNRKGFKALLSWIKKQGMNPQEVIFVMEATGVYYEDLAYYLHQEGYAIVVLLPVKVNNYIKSLNQKTINDITASEALCRLGLERKLDLWKPPSPVFRKLRRLTRERTGMKKEKTALQNKLHAVKHQYDPDKGDTIKRLKDRIKFLDKQIKEVEKQIKQILKTDEEIKEIAALLISVPGIGYITAAAILAETNGFAFTRNIRQITSYAGLDVIQKESGKTIRKKRSISKKGNKYLRAALYFAAITAIQHVDRYGELYKRITDRTGIKRKGIVAVMRKLLELSYTLYKTKTKFIEDFEIQKGRQLDQMSSLQAGFEPLSGHPKIQKNTKSKKKNMKQTKKENLTYI